MLTDELSLGYVYSFFIEGLQGYRSSDGLSQRYMRGLANLYLVSTFISRDDVRNPACPPAFGPAS